MPRCTRLLSIGFCLCVTACSEAPRDPALGATASDDTFVATLRGSAQAGAAVAADIAGSGSNDHVVLARADFGATAFVVGLCVDDPISQDAIIEDEGVVRLAGAQWDAVTGETGGLTIDERYYLSSTIAGHLTGIPPVAPGTFQTLVGIALSTTDLELQLSGSTGPHP